MKGGNIVASFAPLPLHFPEEKREKRALWKTPLWGRREFYRGSHSPDFPVQNVKMRKGFNSLFFFFLREEFLESFNFK